MTPEELARARERADLATELEAMVAHSQKVWEDHDGSYVAEDLLEDLEERLVRVAALLRGRDFLPHAFHHPMPGEDQS